jgi:hypothetical protein
MEKTTLPTIQLQPSPDRRAPAAPDSKALKILAKSIFRELRAQGYEPTQVVSFATEIISLVTSDIAQGDPAP